MLYGEPLWASGSAGWTSLFKAAPRGDRTVPSPIPQPKTGKRTVASDNLLEEVSVTSCVEPWDFGPPTGRLVERRRRHVQHLFRRNERSLERKLRRFVEVLPCSRSWHDLQIDCRVLGMTCSNI
eukprot:1293899-Amphidinium_carterae.1